LQGESKAASILNRKRILWLEISVRKHFMKARKSRYMESRTDSANALWLSLVLSWISETWWDVFFQSGAATWQMPLYSLSTLGHLVSSQERNSATNACICHLKSFGKPT
jgi:hypothetical protein